MHKTAVSLINPSFSISARARTSQAKILHLDQKAAKCTTCKRFCGKFLSCFQQDCDQNLSTRFKTRNGKMSRGEWVKQVCSFQYPSTTTLYRKIIFSQGFQQSSSNMRKMGQYACALPNLVENPFKVISNCWKEFIEYPDSQL